jgi:hypothetical protein
MISIAFSLCKNIMTKASLHIKAPSVHMIIKGISEVCYPMDYFPSKAFGMKEIGVRIPLERVNFCAFHGN